ncbi:hypothetical protein [Gelidibacter salicanalis]|uniref:hypothetical protein n=1 Tax=Gelidibacter salicanalis TaxID=291193 RepID=UPI0018F7502A|nr:hypothetical protein [Gelidibacter salicanalis]
MFIETLNIKDMYQPLLLNANWKTGVITIIIFAIVCATLLGIVINFMIDDKKKNDSDPHE